MRTQVPLSDTVTAYDAFSAGSEGIIVGSPPIWKDDSDATYASFAGQYAGPDNPQFAGGAISDVDPAAAPVSGNPDLADVIVRFRVVVAAGSNVKMPSVRLEHSSGELLVYDAPLHTDAPTSTAWVEVSLQESVAGLRGDFMLEPSAWSLNMQAPGYFEGETVPNEIQRWHVFEVRLFVDRPLGEAASCRNFPADTLNSPGGGVRQFPPSKSWARASRFAGGYG